MDFLYDFKIKKENLSKTYWIYILQFYFRK